MGNKPDLPHLPPSTQPPAGPSPWVTGFSIGTDVPVARPFALAPMSGVTDTAFRRMVQSASGGGVGLFVTEFIAIEGLNKQNMMAQTRMAFDPATEHPLAVQVFGADVDGMVLAARQIERSGAQVFDINCGCPAPKVVRRGGGAGLMRDPDLLARIVEATSSAVSIPVTVKIRSGWDEDSVNAVEVAKRCERAGAAMIAIHGRTRAQLYADRPDWDIVGEVAEAVQVPVIGSGDINSATTALERLRTSGCAGVMIGRAAINNPWIFGQIQDRVDGRIERVPDNAERLRVIRDFHRWMIGHMPERAIPGRLKQLLSRLTKGFPHGMLLRARVLREPTVDHMFRWIESFFEALERHEIERWAEQARLRDQICRRQVKAGQRARAGR